MMKELKIEKLPEIAKRKNGTFFLGRRNEEVAIYSRFKESPYMDAPQYHEVFIIKKLDGKKSAESFNKRFGANYDVENAPDIKEKFPSDEDFGKTAWCYQDLKRAEEKYHVLTAEIEKNKEKNYE